MTNQGVKTKTIDSQNWIDSLNWSNFAMVVIPEFQHDSEQTWSVQWDPRVIFFNWSLANDSLEQSIFNTHFLSSDPQIYALNIFWAQISSWICLKVDQIPIRLWNTLMTLCLCINIDLSVMTLCLWIYIDLSVTNEGLLTKWIGKRVINEGLLAKESLTMDYWSHWQMDWQKSH